MTDNNSTRKYVLLSVDENGNEVRQYNDGSIRDKNGRMLQKIDNHNSDITRENARDYHRMRKEKILRAIEAKVMDITKTNIPADAIAHIVGKRAEIALTDETRTGNEAAKIVLQALDAYQVKETDDVRTNVLRHEYAMDSETIALLERITRMKRDNSTDVLTVDSTDVLTTADTDAQVEDE